MQYENGKFLSGSLICRDIYGNTVTIPLEKMIFCNSVYALIDHGGKLLVVRTHSTGLWGFPGGGIEPGEPLTGALAREVREKTGITVKKGMPTRVNGFEEDFFYYNPGDEADHTCLFFYWCEALSTSLVSDADVFDEESEVPCCLPLADLEPEDFQIIKPEALKLMRESQQA